MPLFWLYTCLEPAILINKLISFKTFMFFYLFYNFPWSQNTDKWSVKCNGIYLHYCISRE